MCLAVPAQVVELDGEFGVVDAGGARRRVNLALLEDPTVGDWVLVHVGFAMAVIDEEEARRTLALFAELDAALED